MQHYNVLHIFLFISFILILSFSFFPCFSKWILLVHCIRYSLLSCHVQFSKWILNVLKRMFLHVCYVLNLIWEWEYCSNLKCNSGTDSYKENILNSAVNVLLVLEQNSSVLLSYKHCFSHYPPESLYLKWLLWCMRLAYIGLHDARSHTYKHNTYIWKLVTTCDCLCSAVNQWPYCPATGVSGSGKARHNFVILVKLHCDCQFW